MQSIWWWVCETQYPELWNKWIEEKVVSIGYAKDELETSACTKLKKSIDKIKPGDWLVVYLKEGRMGGIAEYIEKLRVDKNEFHPLTVDKKEEKEVGIHGCHAKVKWHHLPEEFHYVTVPEGVKTPIRTIKSMKESEFNKIKDAFDNKDMQDHLANSKELASDEKKDLHPKVRDNLEKLEGGLTFYDSDHKLEFKAHPIGSIDILAKDTQGTPVVIEMKKYSVKDAVIGQTVRYMGWVKKHRQRDDVRGIIIAGEITPFTRYAAHAVPNLSLVRYAIKEGEISFYHVSKLLPSVSQDKIS